MAITIIAMTIATEGLWAHLHSCINSLSVKLSTVMFRIVQKKIGGQRTVYCLKNAQVNHLNETIKRYKQVQRVRNFEGNYRNVYQEQLKREEEMADF
jgi:hypothetical protein